MLDLLLQGYEYKADKASLALHEAGLRQEFRPIAEDHSAFFRSEKRSQELKARVAQDDQASEIRLKMMAILADTDDDVDALLLQFLGAALSESTMQMFDPVMECLDRAALTEPFWREVGRAFGLQFGHAIAEGLRRFTLSQRKSSRYAGDIASPCQSFSAALERQSDAQQFVP